MALKFITAEEAATFVHHNDNVGFSGFTPAGCPKVVSSAIAKKAIPNCNLCFISGSEMKTKLSGYLKVLFDADNASVGGKLPGDDFYYEK